MIKKGISQFKELSSGMKKRNTELKEKRKAVDEAKSVWIMLGRLKSLKHLITPLIYLLCNDCYLEYMDLRRLSYGTLL